MSIATCTQTENSELSESAGQFELHAVSIAPEVIANLAEVRVPTPRSVLLGWVEVPPGDPRGATGHALYLTPAGYAYRVTTYLGGRRANGANAG
ncbi:hypothetical protein [Streptomyces sp. A 4/2]|uniref:hypothetical protein n=1 Tax=Streptomyces sp. A 4/2 TaxID=2934314 RepID=UPI002024012D|nr:hypothetical protein [Streptomyces sp. A 4/2]